jgi:hypothetical protein
LGQFLEHVPDSSLHELRWLDYHKFLMAEIMDAGPGLLSSASLLGLPGLRRVIYEALFRSIKFHHVDNFNPEAFLVVRSSIPAIPKLLLQVLI